MANAAAQSELGPVASPSARPRDLSRLAWGVLAYTLLVILFGAVVRITGSGAGCGQHWPTCHGDITYLPETTKNLVEYTHRLTSGLLNLAIFAMAIAAFRRFESGHLVRKAALASVVFVLIEDAIGAALVLLKLVGENGSVARAIWMAAHSINTNLLLTPLVVLAWAASRRSNQPWNALAVGSRRVVVGLGVVLVVAMTGAVTALGDTLYPVDTTADLAARLTADHSVAANFLERGRAIHPIVAITAAGYLLWMASGLADRSPRWARVTQALVFLQVAAGVLNVLLSAPGWMQVVHLALSSTLWIALVLLWASSSDTEAAWPAP